MSFSEQARRAVRRGAQVLVLVVLLAVAPVPPAGAPGAAQADPQQDPVLAWNALAVDALFGPAASPRGMGQPPPVAVQHLAMVQGAVYDAVNQIDGKHQPYNRGLPAAPPSASEAAAVATAAHDVLVGVRMQPALTQALREHLAAAWQRSIDAARARGGERSVDDGIAAGRSAAAAMLAARADDGRYGPFRFTPATVAGQPPGRWATTPPTFSNDPNAWIATVTPWVTPRDRETFRTAGPPALSSDAYVREYEEVKRLGRRSSTARSDAQTSLARFFTAHPVELFNRTFREVAARRPLAEQARLFAMLNMAGADALIHCWIDKARWNYWRPLTAIQTDDGNPRTAHDSTWEPLIDNPPYPDHPSGYNCITSGIMHTAEAFFEAKEKPFSLVVPGSPPRAYARFRDVVDDTVDARVWAGLHFRSADTQAAGLGQAVARHLEQSPLFDRVRR